MIFSVCVLMKRCKIRTFTAETKAQSSERETKLALGVTPLFLVEKSDRARIQAVIAADYLYVARINFSFENWSR